MDVYVRAKDLMAAAYPGISYEGKTVDFQAIRRRPMLEDSVYKKLVSAEWKEFVVM